MQRPAGLVLPEILNFSNKFIVLRYFQVFKIGVEPE